MSDRVENLEEIQSFLHTMAGLGIGIKIVGDAIKVRPTRFALSDAEQDAIAQSIVDLSPGLITFLTKRLEK